MAQETEFRAARPDDVHAIVGLLRELNCVVDASEVAERLDRIEERASDQVFVAVENDEVIGLLSLHLVPLLHRDWFGRITAFVVTEPHRGRGVGKLLLREAEAWAVARGCTQIEVNSGDHHQTSHGFYTRHGYRSDDRRFVKEAFDEALSREDDPA